MSTDPVKEPLPVADDDTLARLAAIEDHVHQIEIGLGAIAEFNGQLEEIHTALKTVIGLVTTGRSTESFAAPIAHVQSRRWRGTAGL